MAENMQQNEYRRGQGRQLRNKSGGNVEIQENTNVVQANRSVAMNAASVATMGKSTGAQLLETLTALGSVVQGTGRFAKSAAVEKSLEGNGARQGLNASLEIDHMIKTGEIGGVEELPEDQAGPQEPSVADRVNEYIDASVAEGGSRAEGIQRWAQNSIDLSTAGDTDEVRAAFAKEYYEPTVKSLLAWDADNEKTRRDDMGGDIAFGYATEETFTPLSSEQMAERGFTTAETQDIFTEAATAAAEAGRFDRAREIMKKHGFRDDRAAGIKLKGDIAKLEQTDAQAKIEEAMGKAVYGQLDGDNLNAKTLRLAVGDQTDANGLRNFDAGLETFVDQSVAIGTSVTKIRADMRNMLDMKDGDGYVIERGSQAHRMLLNRMADIPEEKAGITSSDLSMEQNTTDAMIAEYVITGKIDGKKVETEEEFLGQLDAASQLRGANSLADYHAYAKQYKGSGQTRDVGKQMAKVIEYRREIDNATTDEKVNDIVDRMVADVDLLGTEVKALYEKTTQIRGPVIAERNSAAMNEMLQGLRMEYLRATGLSTDDEFITQVGSDPTGYLEYLATAKLPPGAIEAWVDLRISARLEWMEFVNTNMNQINKDGWEKSRLEQIKGMNKTYTELAQTAGRTFAQTLDTKEE